jgi:hypothetical protein
MNGSSSTRNLGIIKVGHPYHFGSITLSISELHISPFVFYAKMDWDDDAPPDLVGTGASLDAEEKPVKVPITIVTGSFWHGLISFNGSRG